MKNKHILIQFILLQQKIQLQQEKYWTHFGKISQFGQFAY